MPSFCGYSVVAAYSQSLTALHSSCFAIPCTPNIFSRLYYSALSV